MSDTLQSYTIEAENLQLDGYTAQTNSSDASGGGYIQTWGTGTASTTFEGAAGTYSFDLSVFDENDGQSTINIYVNGEVVASVTMDQDLNGNYIHNTLTTITVEGIELQPGDELSFEGIAQSGEPARIDKIDLIQTSTELSGTGTHTLLCESFGNAVWGDVVSSDFTSYDGAAFTNGNNDGTLMLRPVDLSHYENATLTLDAGHVNGGFEEAGTQYGDFFRIEIIDAAGNVTVLDTFSGSGNTLVGSNTGQVIDPGLGQLSYDLPEGMGSVQVRIVSEISASCEELKLDNIKITAEKAAPQPVIDAVDDSITVFESEGEGDTETLDDGSSSVLANDTEDGSAYAGTVVEVNGQTGSVGDWIDLAEGGRVMISADGTVDFDAAGDFDALNNGESAQVTVDYTIASQEELQKTHNVLLVIDVSNSTVGIDGQNQFDGAGVGDVNNDGRADTVLDAQIVAAQALIDDLRAQGVDPSKVNVGIVTFSGVDTTGASSYNDATVDSEVVGTFSLGDSSIDSALSDILSGGWTNYEAGLSEAESWFAANAGAGDSNKMYFLSDGRPITSFENGAYVEQNTSQFLDEVARIENSFDADIHGIGVGANSSLQILNQIDNTGGAVQVTNAAALTAALLDGPDLITVTDTATVTVTILGEDTPPPPAPTIDAIDDLIIVDENETAGDVEDIQDEAGGTVGTILADDLEGTGPYTGGIVEINGESAKVNEWVQLFNATGNSQGRVKVNELGEVDFDADGDGVGGSDFSELDNGDTAQVTFEYTIALPETTQPVTRTIDFSGFAAGTVISDQITGLTISAQRNGDGPGSANDAMIFDSSDPTGGDPDLATPSNGNILIISEDNDSSDPDDNAGGGSISIDFDFDEPTKVEQLTFIDTEEGGATIVFTVDNGDGTTSEVTQTGPQTLDGQIGTFTAGVANVVSITISLIGSGAIDDIVLSEEVVVPGVSDTAVVTVQIDGLDDPTPTFNLSGSIDTTVDETRSITFLVDFSSSTFNPQSSGALGDLNGDNGFTTIDYILSQVVLEAQNFPADQELNFILTGTDGVVSELAVTAGELQTAFASVDPAAPDAITQYGDALSPIFSPAIEPATATPAERGFNQDNGDATELDVTKGLEAAKAYILSQGTDLNEVIVITTTEGFDDLGIPGISPGVSIEDDLDGDGVVAVPFSDPDPVVAELEALGASIDVIQINPGQSTFPDVLLDVDQDTMLTIRNDGEAFGLDALIDDPASGPAGEVISITVGTQEFLVDDPMTGSFDFDLTGIDANPLDGVKVNISTDADDDIELVVDVDPVFNPATDTFEFSLDFEDINFA